MMTDRWVNIVLAVVVLAGLSAVVAYERPRSAEERAEFLGQDTVTTVDDPGAPASRERDAPAITAPSGTGEQVLDQHGVSASHPLAVEVGMQVLEAGGNAVDAAVAVSYTLGVVEPFGSGPGGGGAMLVHGQGQEPRAYDYREVAPSSGEVPSSDIGVPGFVAGMAHVHAQHGSVDIAELIEPAARRAEDGFEVSGYLHERLHSAGHRLPIHRLPQLFPEGAAIEESELLRQPEYAEALRAVQEDGPAIVYEGELGQRIADEVSGLEPADFEAYEVLEVDPAVGRFADLDVIGGGPPVSGPTLVQHLQLAEALDVAAHPPGSPEFHHAVAQAYRLALADRTEYVSDPSAEDVPLDGLLDPEYARDLAGEVPGDGFVHVDEEEAAITPEADTTHLVVVDREGTMVSATNTLSNFFGSGLPVSGFFLNDQLKNFSSDPDSINTPAPGKRPRSFVTPVIVADGGTPVLGLGSPGGRRIPMVTAQALIRWAAHSEDLAEAAAAPRFHLEGHRLFLEEEPDSDVADALAGWGYELVLDEPTTEFYGAIQALRVDAEAGTVDGVADDRREGTWESR